jgi:chromosome segregation ATPase
LAWACENRAPPTLDCESIAVGGANPGGIRLAREARARPRQTCQLHGIPLASAQDCRQETSMFEQLSLGTKAKKRGEELNAMVLAARHERDALDALFEQLDGRRGRLAEVSTTVEHVRDKAIDASEQLAAIASRIADLDKRVSAFETVSAHVEEMTDVVQQAREAAALMIESGGQLEKHREAMALLADEYRDARGAIDALATQRQIVTDAREELQRSHSDLRGAADQAASIKRELDQLRGQASALANDQAAMSRTAEQVQDSTAVVTRTMKDVEARLASLGMLHDLAATTEERLRSLNALAEHVNVKTKALDTQRATVDHAASEAARLNEMVWAMEAQIGRLEEGTREVARVEDLLHRAEALAKGTQTELDDAGARRELFARETARVEKEGAQLIQTVCAQLERLSIEGKSFEAHEQRIAALLQALGSAERQLETVLERQEAVSVVDRQAEALGQAVRQLATEVGDLSSRRADVEALAERLGRVETIARDAESRQARLEAGRKQLDDLRAELDAVHASRASAAALCSQLHADRTALEKAGENIARFSVEAPGIEKQIEAILEKFGTLDEADRTAERTTQAIAELEAVFARSSEKLQFVEKVERRLQGLHTLNTEVGRRMEEQLARRAELDGIRTRIDEVTAHITDAHQKLDAIRTAQEKLPAILESAATLARDVEGLDTRMTGLTRSEADLADQERRLETLVAASREYHAAIADRTAHLEALAEELHRGSALKNELIADLARVQAQHRETAVRMAATEDQLRHVDALRQQLDDRQAALTAAEQRMMAFEAQMEKLARLAADTDLKIQAIAARELMVAVVRTEVDKVQEVAAATKRDVHAIVERGHELETLRTRLDALVQAFGDTDERIAVIETRRALVDEVQSRTEMIANLIDDIGANLEMVAAQKAQIEYVSDQVARLEFSVQQSQNTIRALHFERERAERVEAAIRQLRTRDRSTRPSDAATPDNVMSS